jgi:hypothetical protein
MEGRFWIPHDWDPRCGNSALRRCDVDAVLAVSPSGSHQALLAPVVAVPLVGKARSDVDRHNARIRLNAPLGSLKSLGQKPSALPAALGVKSDPLSLVTCLSALL